MSGLYKVIIIIAIVLLSGCSSKEANPDKKINVVVTIVPYKYFVEKIGGDKTNVNVLIPPSSSPHTYEPMPEQIKQILESDIYFKVGGEFHFEKELLRNFSSIKENMTIVDCARNIQVINNDPHFWLAPSEVKTISRNILKGLSKYSAKDSVYFQTNFNRFIAEIDSVDNLAKNKFDSLHTKDFLVYHEAWKYFSMAYNLNELVIEEEGKEPKIQHLQAIIDSSKASEIKTLFIDPQTNLKLAEAVAKQINAEIVLINPLPENFLDNLTDVSDKIMKSNK